MLSLGYRRNPELKLLLLGSLLLILLYYNNPNSVDMQPLIFTQAFSSFLTLDGEYNHSTANLSIEENASLRRNRGMYCLYMYRSQSRPLKPMLSLF